MIMFGTGGIRGVMKEGEFDDKTVSVTTKGVAEYMKMNGLKRVLIAYDTRNNSERFAKLTASVLQVKEWMSGSLESLYQRLCSLTV